MLAPRQHHLPLMDIVRAGDGAPAAPLRGWRGHLHRKDVIDQELQAALALVLVYVESINEVHSARGGDEAVALFDVIKGNCIERAPCSWDFNPHFQVTV